MTKEDFLKKNEWYCEEKFNKTTGKIKVVKIYFHNGDTVEKGDKIFDFNSSDRTNAPFTADANGQIKYCFKSVPAEMDSGEIFAIIENTKMSRLWDEKSVEYENFVEEHRKSGDLIEWCVKESNENADIYYIIEAFITENEINDYKDALIECHNKKGDFIEWVFDCKKNDNDRYFEILGRDSAKNLLREKFQKEISEHRAKGDLIDYLWEIIEKYNLGWYGLCATELSTERDEYLTANRPLEYLILRGLLKKEERYELDNLDSVVLLFGDKDEYLLGYSKSAVFKYIFKLYKSPKKSIRYKRYEKIKSKITKVKTLEELEKSIKSASRELILKNIGILISFLLVSVVVFFALF